MRLRTRSLEPYAPLPPSTGSVVRGTGIHQLPGTSIVCSHAIVGEVRTDESHSKNQEHVAQETAEESALDQGNVALEKVHQS